MKNILFLIIFFIVFIEGCDLIDIENDLVEINVNGKVEYISEKSYDAIEEDGIITKGKRNDTSNRLQRFNRKGFLVEEIFFDINDQVNYSYTYEYNEQSQIISQTKYDSGEVETESYHFIYDGDLLIKELYYSSPNELSSFKDYIYNNNSIDTVYDYDSNMLLNYYEVYTIIPNDTFEITEIKLFNNEKEIRRTCYEKKLNSRLIESRLYNNVVDGQGSVTSYSYYRRYNWFFDSNNNLIEYIFFQNVPDAITKTISISTLYTYIEYDRKNNWIAKHSEEYYHNEGQYLDTYFEREIEYY